MLVFGKCPERFIPSAYLSFEFFDHNQIICGNIYSIINTVINELTQMYPQKIYGHCLKLLQMRLCIETIMI